ncbi:MAG: hypothetical protein ACXAEU_12355 [Candidatus Hodarchaeales archaeon]
MTLQGVKTEADMFDYGAVVDKFSSFLRTSNKFKNVEKSWKDNKSLLEAEPEILGGPQLTFALNHLKGSFLLLIRGNFGHFLSEYVRFIESLGLTAVKIQLADLDGEDNYYQSSWKQDKRNMIPHFMTKASDEGWLYGEFVIKIYFLRGKKKDAKERKMDDLAAHSSYSSYPGTSQPTEIMYRERKLSKLARREVSDPVILTPRISHVKSAVIEEKPRQEYLDIYDQADIDHNEKLVLKEIMARTKRKAQSNHLKKTTGLDQELIRKILRGLVEKGVLQVSSGWYILPDKMDEPASRSEMSAGKKLASTDEKVTPGTTEKTATKSISRTTSTIKTAEGKVRVKSGFTMIKEFAELDYRENLVINAILQRPRQKAQSNLLKKQLDMDQEDIKEILRTLVKKGHLKIVSGWYSISPEIISADPSLASRTEEPAKKPAVDIQDKISTANLTDTQKKILNAILQREKKKAQSNLLKKVLKLDQDTIKQNLRELVKSGFLTISSGWYIAKKDLYEEDVPTSVESADVGSIVGKKARVITPRDIRILKKEGEIFVLYKNKKLPFAQNFLMDTPSAVKRMNHPMLENKQYKQEQLNFYTDFINESVRYLILKLLSEKSALPPPPPRFIVPEDEKKVAEHFPHYKQDVEMGLELFNDFFAKNDIQAEQVDLILLSEKYGYFSWLDFIGTINGESHALNFNITFSPPQDKSKGYVISEIDRLLGSATKEAMKENGFAINKLAFFQIYPVLFSDTIDDLESNYQLINLRKNKFKSFKQVLKDYEQKRVKSLQGKQHSNDQFPNIVDIVREVVELRELSKIGKIADEGEGIFDPLETFNYLTVREQYTRYGILKELAKQMNEKEPKLIFSCESEEDYFHTIKNEPDLYEDYVNGLKIFKKFLREYEVQPLEINILVKSKKYKYNGTLDMVARIGEKSIAIKISTMTGNVADEDRMAGAAYFQAAKETLIDMKIEKMGWLQIAPELLYADDILTAAKPYSFTLFQNRRNKLDDFLKLLRKFRSSKSSRSFRVKK